MLTFLNSKLKELDYSEPNKVELLEVYGWEKQLKEPYSAYTRMIIYDTTLKRMQVFDYSQEEQHVIFVGKVEKEKEFNTLIKMLEL